MCQWLGIFDPTNLLLLRKSCILRRPKARQTNFEGFVAMVRSKNTSPTWSDVKTALMDFDRASLRGARTLLESCSMEEEGYFTALIRMYERSLEIVSNLSPAGRTTYLERLDKLRSRGRNVGWAAEEELNSLWYAAAPDEHQSE